MKNTAVTPGLPRSPSLPHYLQQSTRLVRSDLGYFKRNSIISTMQFLLHNGHHDQKPGRWDLGWCKFLFIVIVPQCITLHHHLTDAFIVVCILVLLGWMLIMFGGGLLALQDATCNNQLRWDKIWMDHAMNHFVSGGHHNDCMEMSDWICLPTKAVRCTEMFVVSQSRYSAEHQQVMQWDF
jgi:hypothetical protein